MKRIALIIGLTLVAGCAVDDLPSVLGAGKSMDLSDLSLLYVAGAGDDEQLFLASGGNSLEQLTQYEEGSLGDIHLSVDGKIIAFSRWRDDEVGIYAMMPGDAGPTQVVHPDAIIKPGRKSYEKVSIGDEFDLAADGSSIVFTSTDAEGSGSGFASQTELYAADFDGGNRTLLLDTNSEMDSVRYPVFSPDGSRIAFARSTASYHDAPSGIYLVNRDGTDLRWVADTSDVGSGYLDSLAWSPDGSRVVIVDQQQDSVYVVGVDDGSAPVAVHDVSTSEESVDFGRPVFSPDGSTIALRRFSMVSIEALSNASSGTVASSRPGLSAEIFVVNADGSDLRQPTDNGSELQAVSDPVFTPDGRSVVFTGGPMSPTATPDDFGIYRVDLDSGDAELLLDALATKVAVGSRPA